VIVKKILPTVEAFLGTIIRATQLKTGSDNPNAVFFAGRFPIC